MKSTQLYLVRVVFIIVAMITISLTIGASCCDAQWGFFGRGTTASRGAFKTSRYGSAFGANPYDRYGLNGPALNNAGFNSMGLPSSAVFNQYRGIQPTQSELDREKFYYNLDRTHRYQTREERYANDFFNAYASPSAMVNRYRYPYVAGTPSVPWTPQPVPGLSIGRHESRYQGYVPDDDVAMSLRAAANRLQRSLSKKSDGHVWIRHLRPDLIIDTIDRGQHPGVLADLVVNYQGVGENPRLVLISESEGFQDVRHLLAQYVTLPSPYPGDGEVLIDERVSGEQTFEQGFSESNQTMLAPPLPPRLPPTMPVEVNDGSIQPRLDSLPDEADVELLPAPLPSPIK